MNTPPTPTNVPPVDAPPADPPPVDVSVNGEPRRIAPGTTLDVLVTGLTSAPSGVAAAVNETVVPRGSWSRTALGDGDRVEILTAVQGG